MCHVPFQLTAVACAKNHAHPRNPCTTQLAPTDRSPAAASTIVATATRVGGKGRGDWDFLGVCDPAGSNFCGGSTLHLVARQYSSGSHHDHAHQSTDLWILVVAGLSGRNIRDGRAGHGHAGHGARRGGCGLGRRVRFVRWVRPVWPARCSGRSRWPTGRRWRWPGRWRSRCAGRRVSWSLLGWWMKSATGLVAWSHCERGLCLRGPAVVAVL